jgi:hypothetical protein
MGEQGVPAQHAIVSGKAKPTLDMRESKPEKYVSALIWWLLSQCRSAIG